jgi:heptosyltransferase-2
MARSSEHGSNGNGNGHTPASNGAQSDPARILIVLPNWVGDLVLATPALRAMRARFAESKITFLVKPHLADILAGGDWMNDTVYWPAKGRTRAKNRQGFLGLAGELRDRDYDWAVLLTNSFRSAMLTRLAAIRRRVGYDRDGRGLLLTDKLLAAKADGKYLPVPMTRYYNAIARYLGCRDCPTKLELYTTPREEAIAEQTLVEAGIEKGRPFIVLNPAASFGPAKCWLPERFAEVGDQLAREHGAAVFIMCGPKETQIARQVAGTMREAPVVLDRPVLPLGPSKALIRRASLLVTNDTGPRHFANAFGTPVVTIFGPTDPEWTATDAAAERSLMVPVDCGPCMKRHCPLDHRCMTRISSDMVLEKARELLTTRVPSL